MSPDTFKSNNSSSPMNTLNRLFVGAHAAPLSPKTHEIKTRYEALHVSESSVEPLTEAAVKLQDLLKN